MATEVPGVTRSSESSIASTLYAPPAVYAIHTESLPWARCPEDCSHRAYHFLSGVDCLYYHRKIDKASIPE